MLARIVGYMHWSNAKLIAWAKDQPAFSADQTRLLSHNLNVAAVWIARANGSLGDKDTFRVHRLEDMPALNDANHQGFLELLRSDAKRIVDYRTFDGTPVRSGIEDMILHVFTHGFHHEGQIAAMAAKMGVTPPNLAYITYIRIMHPESPG